MANDCFLSLEELNTAIAKAGGLLEIIDDDDYFNHFDRNDQGDYVFIPDPINEFPPAHYLRLKDVG